MIHKIGSCYFFEGMPGFKPHDRDYLELVDTNAFEKRTVRGHGEDWFFLKRKTKSELIDDALKSNLPMVVGKFLIPGFCQEIGFTVEDLPLLEEQFGKLDPKHSYERVIYEAYIANGGMVLNDTQREAAYEEYRNARKSDERKSIPGGKKR